MPVGVRTDPVAGFRFGVEISGIVEAWFTECSGLSIERDTLPVEEGGVNDYVHKLPERIKYTTVSLKRGVADNALWDWFCKGLYDGKVERKNISIILYNADRSQARRFNLANAYPTRWQAGEMRTESTQAFVETLEIVHHGLTVTDWTAA
jgi:phage tail-like protein